MVDEVILGLVQEPREISELSGREGSPPGVIYPLGYCDKLYLLYSVLFTHSTGIYYQGSPLLAAPPSCSIQLKPNETENEKAHQRRIVIYCFLSYQRKIVLISSASFI